MHGLCTLLLVLLLGCLRCDAGEPMSPCLNSRSTYYTYANNGGACQFGPLGGTRLPFTHVAAASQPYYNNSMACGECYEVTGPSGTVMVVIADLCPGQGGDTCGDKIIHFDLGSEATFDLVAPHTLGVVLDTIKKVSCPVTGDIGVYFVPGTSEYYVAFVAFNHRVGIALAELQPNGGQYYSMVRVSNQWTYDTSFGPTVSLPYNVRLTGVTGEQLTFSLNTYAPTTTVTATGVQFAEPDPGFGGSTPDACSAPLPPDVIYDDYLYNGNGAPSNAWHDWSFGTSNNYASTNNPYSGTQCWASSINGYGGIQLGRDIGITWAGEFTHLQFAIRADSDFDSLAISWGGNNEYSLSITTTWTLLTLSLATDLNSPASIGDTGAVLTFKNNAGTTSPMIYLDEMVFLPRNNASYIRLNFPPGSDDTGGGSSSASVIGTIPLAVLVAVLFCFLRSISMAS